MDIVIHIGLPRSGTSTLQNKLFPKLPVNFLGGNWEETGLLTKASFTGLRKLVFNDNFPDDDRSWLTKKWFDDAKKKCVSYEQNVVMSYEALSMWPTKNGSWPISSPPCPVFLKTYKKTSEYPIIHFVRDFLLKSWPWGKVKLVLVLRNQIDYCASLYSRTSENMVEAGQKHFEKKVLDVAKNKMVQLDWYSLVRGLEEVLGPKNVHVALYEEIFNDANAQNDLVRFICGSEVDDLHLRKQQTIKDSFLTRQNKFQVGDTEGSAWGLSSFNPSRGVSYKWWTPAAFKKFCITAKSKMHAKNRGGVFLFQRILGGNLWSTLRNQTACWQTVLINI